MVVTTAINASGEGGMRKLVYYCCGELDLCWPLFTGAASDKALLKLTSCGLKPSRTKSSFRILNVPETFEQVTKNIIITLIISGTCYV